MQDSHIKRFMTRKEKKNGMTLHKYQTTIFDHLEDERTLLQEDFHVKPFQSPGNVEGLKIQGEHFSLKLQGRLKKSNHLMLYWKTSKAYSHTTKGELSEQSFKRWMNWGMSLNGVCLTVNSGEYPKIENEYLS